MIDASVLGSAEAFFIMLRMSLEQCYNLANWLSHYLYFFSFLFFSFLIYNYKMERSNGDQKV